MDHLFPLRHDGLRRHRLLLDLAGVGHIAQPAFAPAGDHLLVEGEHRRAALLGPRGRDDRASAELRDILRVHEREVLEERHRLDLGEVGQRALTEPVAAGVVIGELVGILDDKEAERAHLVVAELMVPVVGKDARAHHERVGKVFLVLAALLGRVVVPVEKHAFEDSAGPGGVELHFGIVPAQLLDVGGIEDVDGGKAVADDRFPLAGLVFFGHIPILSKSPYSLMAPAFPAPSPPVLPAALFAAAAASAGSGFFSAPASSRREY